MDERAVRLECLRLAIQHYPDREADTVVTRAGQFEKFVIGTGNGGANTLRLPGKDREPSPKGR